MLVFVPRLCALRMTTLIERTVYTWLSRAMTMRHLFLWIFFPRFSYLKFWFYCKSFDFCHFFAIVDILPILEYFLFINLFFRTRRWIKKIRAKHLNPVLYRLKNIKSAVDLSIKIKSVRRESFSSNNLLSNNSVLVSAFSVLKKKSNLKFVSSTKWNIV